MREPEVTSAARREPTEPEHTTPRRTTTIVVPLMLAVSSVIMALAWLGHLRFEEWPLALAILAAWLLVLPEYAINISALRLGYGTYTGGQMAAFRLCSGVVCVALVSQFVLGEQLTTQKFVGFGLMIVALAMISHKPEAVGHDDERGGGA